MVCFEPPKFLLSSVNLYISKVGRPQKEWTTQFPLALVDHVHHLNIKCLSGLVVNQTPQFPLAWVNYVHKQHLLAEQNL